MNQFNIHLRKDLKLLTSDSLFIIFILLLVVVSFVLALSAGNYYRYSVGSWNGIVTKHSIDIAQTNSLNQYWLSVLQFEGIVFLVVSAMAMSQDKESGMLSYILTFKTDKKMFFTSKFLVILMMVAIGVVVSTAMYLIAFSMMDVPVLSIETILESMIFPAAFLIVLSSIGLLLSTVLKKKSVAIVVAIVLFSALSILYSFSIMIATSEAYKAPDFDYNHFMDFVPLQYKLLIWANPLILLEGAKNLMTSGDVGYNSTVWLSPEMSIVAAAIMAAFYLLVGLYFFGREQKGKPSMLRSLLGRALRGKE